MSDELDNISKSIDEYNLVAEEGGVPLTDDAFLFGLKSLMGTAKKNKDKQPKTEKTRYWAVIYTDLEKILAYVAQNL